eukprot:m.13794 g.13794  ORF g.13794 m.13794 type:complete len:136 (-) comp3325_c0_seq1:2359-2766(-)
MRVQLTSLRAADASVLSLFVIRFADFLLCCSRAQDISNDRDSFLSVMNAAGINRDNWDNQPHCNIRAFNLVHCCDNTNCRYGISMNNENECNSNDAAIGLGCYTNNKSSGRQIGAGGFRWSPTERFPVKAYILVR